MKTVSCLRLLTGLAILAAALFPPAWTIAKNRLRNPVALRVIGQSDLAAGATATFRVTCIDPVTGAPRGACPVEIALTRGSTVLASGHHTSSPAGEALATLDVPPGLEGPFEVRVSASSAGVLGRDTDAVSRSVQISRRQKILLSTDKPFYQPGQKVHIRALALALPGTKPLVGSPVRFEVLDSKGNKVFKEERPVSEFGVAGATFLLADVVNEGDYKIRASVVSGPDARASSAQERTVTVKRYVLPKFKLELTTDRPFYRPGETLAVRVKARYFFGKPVGGALVAELSPFTAGFAPASTAVAQLSAGGEAQVDLPIPPVLAGLETEGGRALVLVKAKVTDLAGHSHEVSRTFPVCAAPLVVEAIPESGRIVPRVENIVYVVVARPDGSPVPGATVSVEGEPIAGTTDAAGIVELKVTPGASFSSWPLAIDVKDGTRMRVPVTLYTGVRAPKDRLEIEILRMPADVGETIRVVTRRARDLAPVKTSVRIPALNLADMNLDSAHSFAVSAVPDTLVFEVTDETGGRQTFRRGMSHREFIAPGRDSRSGGSGTPDEEAGPATTILLRTDDGLYKVGGTARLTVLASDPTGTVYLDVVREGQTVLTRTVELAGGRADLSLDLTPDMAGTLKLHAYRILSDGTIVRSGKVIVVGSARALSVSVKSDRDTYVPGEKATLDLAVTDEQGRPTRAVLGIDVVDESVFALADFVPGLERVYFAIEKELAEPKYQLKCSPQGLDLAGHARHRWCEKPELAADLLSRIARVLLAPVVPDSDLDVVLQTIEKRRAELRQVEVQTFSGLLSWMLMPILPATLGLLLVWILARGAALLPVPDVELGSKQERVYAKLVLAASLPALIVLVLGAPAAVVGGPGALAVALVLLAALFGFLGVWSGPESRAHLPEGAGFHAGPVLLFAYGATATVVLVCRFVLGGALPPLAISTVVLVLVAPCLALVVYTCQVLEPGRRSRQPDEGASWPFALALVGWLCAPLVWAFTIEASGLFSWQSRHALEGPGPAALWLFLGPPVCARIALGVTRLSRGAQQAFITLMAISTWIGGLAAYSVLVDAADYSSPVRVMLDESALILGLVWLVAGPVLGYHLARALGLTWATGRRDPVPASGRLWGLRSFLAAILPVALLVAGLVFGAIALESMPWQRRSVIEWLVPLAALAWLGLGPLLGSALGRAGRLSPPGYEGSSVTSGAFTALAVLFALAWMAVPNFKAGRYCTMALRRSAMGGAAREMGDDTGGPADTAGAAAPATPQEKAGVRIRSYFPETLYSTPALVTDDGGRVRLELPLADSITTWRMTGLASSRSGDLGSFTHPIRVFQEFFLDLDLPVALTKGDEVALPVAVYNYLDRPQEVKLELDEGSWYSLDGPRTRVVKLGAGEVRAERFRIKALSAGTHQLTVWGLGTARKDAIRRDVKVLPDGHETTTATNGLLDREWEAHAMVPPASLDRQERLVCRIYPSAASQVVEGLETMIRGPHG